MPPAVTDKTPNACNAPDLDDATLAKYKALVNSIPNGPMGSSGVKGAEVRDAAQTCLKCVEAWWALPESERTDVERWTTNRVVGGKLVAHTYAIVPLEQEHVVALDSVTPFMRELNDIQANLFDKLPTGTVSEGDVSRVVDQAAFDLKNALYHLLWHAKEITLDREPLTRGKVFGS